MTTTFIDERENHGASPVRHEDVEARREREQAIAALSARISALVRAPLPSLKLPVVRTQDAWHVPFGAMSCLRRAAAPKPVSRKRECTHIVAIVAAKRRNVCVALVLEQQYANKQLQKMRADHNLLLDLTRQMNVLMAQ
jgi:hypothetical protein